VEDTGRRASAANSVITHRHVSRIPSDPRIVFPVRYEAKAPTSKRPTPRDLGQPASALSALSLRTLPVSIYQWRRELALKRAGGVCSALVKRRGSRAQMACARATWCRCQYR
jgi:hypothetical protein